MKGLRTAALVFASLGVFVGFINFIKYGKMDPRIITTTLNISEELASTIKLAYIIVSIAVFILSVADIIIMSNNAKGNIVLIFGIISVIFASSIAGILMIIYYVLNKKKQNSSQPLLENACETNQTNEIRFCSQCGAEIKAGDKYCISCGHHVE